LFTACKAFWQPLRHVVTTGQEIQPSLCDADVFRSSQAVNDLPQVNRHYLTKKVEQKGISQNIVKTHFIMHSKFIAAITLLALLALAVASEVVPQTPPVTLTIPTTPEKAPNVDGFIQRWLLLEPIAANGLTDSAVQALVKKEHFPDQFTVVPRDGDRAKVGGAELAWHAVDTVNYNVNLFHFARAHGKKTSDVLFWAVTVINCPREMRDVRLAIGSNAASVWWVNGKEVIGIYGDRQTVIDDGVSKRLTLKQGQNIIRGAIVNGGGATDFCARLLDAGDKPIKDITVSLGKVQATPAGAKTRR